MLAVIVRQGSDAAEGGPTRWCQQLQQWNNNQLATIKQRRRSNDATAQQTMMVAVKRGQQWRSNNCVAVEERILDMAMEEQQLPNPCWRTSNLGRMWRRTTAADKRRCRAMKACQQATAMVGGWGAMTGRWQLSRVDSSEGANMEYRVAEEETAAWGAAAEARHKCATHPSGKAATNAQHRWGRESKLMHAAGGVRSAMHRHGFVRNLGRGWL